VGGPDEMGLGEAAQDGVVRDTAYEAVAHAVDEVEELGVGESGVEAMADGDGELMRFGRRAAEEAGGAGGGRGVTLPQDGVEESVAETGALKSPLAEKQATSGEYTVCL